MMTKKEQRKKIVTANIQPTTIFLILFCSSQLCSSNVNYFILICGVFTELCTIYYASTAQQHLPSKFGNKSIIGSGYIKPAHIPGKTRTCGCRYGFPWVRVQVALENPRVARGIPYISYTTLSLQTWCIVISVHASIWAVPQKQPNFINPKQFNLYFLHIQMVSNV